jgi:cyclophilin family peptidyl-prolyl cis-trans isomerase
MAFAVALVACGSGSKDRAGTQGGAPPPGCTSATAPPAKTTKLKRPPKGARLPAGANVIATVQTNCGNFAFALDVRQAPKTTSSFAYLVRKGVYSNTLVHRIQPGFVIQGGDPLGTGRGGPGYTIDERPPGNLAYTLGTVAMARTQVEPPGRSGSQFFVVTAPDAGLDPSFALLGHVTTGLDVVQRIGQYGTPDGIPTETVVIRKVTLAGA